MELNQLTIKQASEKLQRGEITSVELTGACLTRIKGVDKKIHACLTVCEEGARRAAKEADVRRSKGESGNLLGIPYLAKDNIMTKGVKTTAASKILENYTAPYDATVIRKLKEAGAVLLGKTNLDEFAHGPSTENSAFGPTHNPWDVKRVPGGSSGGSGAAVAADMCLFALGTDTGGSVRHPAGFCGITGLKPTYGRASRFGLIAMASSTDVPGVLTKTAEDASLILQVIADKDKNDGTTVGTTVGARHASSLPRCRGIKIGLPREYFNDNMEKGVARAIEQAIEKLKELGAEFAEVNLPHTKYGVPVYYIIISAEISSNLARFDGIRYGLSDQKAKTLAEVYTKSRGRGFGPEAKRRIMLGTYVLSAGYYDAYYVQAQKVRTKIKEEMDEALNSVDCLLTPTAPHTAFKIGQQNRDSLTMYLEDVFLVNASLTGVPAISIPCGFSNNMPVGMQLIGRRFDENMLFKVSGAYQQATDWHEKRALL